VTTYLYGLVLSRSAHLVPAHIAGLHATPLRVIPCDESGLGALVSTLDRAPERASLDDIRAHDHALQSVVQHGSTTAAVRFGQTFATESDVQRHVAVRAERIERVLEEFDGCVEMRILLPMAVEPSIEDDRTVSDATGPGRAYLEGLRARGPGRLKDVTLRDALGPVVRAERVEELAGARGAVFAHLVARSDELAYRAAIAQLPALKEARIAGPLAFYSFAEPGE
jgi:hypothetical protein